MKLRLALCLTVAAVVACSATSPDSKSEVPPVGTTTPKRTTATDAAAKLPAAKLPQGVVAQARGKLGLIQVRETGQLRALTIDGILQGARFMGGFSALNEDPIVPLIRAMRPKAKTALLIGLGTGKTATGLSKAGFEVTALEIEPKVIEFARKYFGFKGKAISANGVDYIKSNKKKYDVVIIDAFNGKQLPPDLISVKALRTMVGFGSDDLVIAARLTASPGGPAVKRLWNNMRRAGRMQFPQMFGMGLGDERQPLFAVTSARPLNFANASKVRPWPLQMSSYRRAVATRDPVQARAKGSLGRGVRLLGYIIKLSGGEIALDLPHFEMGAMRFLLTGEPAKTLGQLIPAGAKFPTAGDIRSDGSRRGTLHSVFGGGGSKRSEVRFSPVVAAVRGVARLRSVVHPNAALGVPQRFRKGAANDPRLPYGGALYELDVKAIDWSFTYEQWRELQRKARPHIGKAIGYLRGARLGRAVKEIKGYLHPFERRFKRGAGHILAYQLLKHRFDKLKTVAFKLGGKATPFQTAVACDTATAGYIASMSGTATAAARIVRALKDCARSGYEKAMKRDKSNRDASVRRLLSLYDVVDDGIGTFKAKVLQRKLRRLRKRFPGLKPLQSAP